VAFILMSETTSPEEAPLRSSGYICLFSIKSKDWSKKSCLEKPCWVKAVPGMDKTGQKRHNKFLIHGE
jgi:hypothetical protein